MTEAPAGVMTYDDSSPGQVVPVSAESAEAAFNDACGDSFYRHEDTTHPASHIGKSGVTHTLLLKPLDLAQGCTIWTIFESSVA